MRAFTKGQKFSQVSSEDTEFPVFSESFLYERMSKEDARFILGVAEEYEVIIDLLGKEKVVKMLRDYKGNE